MTKAIEKHSTAFVRAAIERAQDYADQHKVPLTAERLAAELGVSVTQLHELVQPAYQPDNPRFAPPLELIRHAFAQATASVVEHAMQKGSSVNMHMLYLRQYAGYEQEEEAGGAAVYFEGEQELP